mmetsp:Transcript_9292/g.14353  ORF Transcript_9292/g.14353 Transcript_9292/m.14353 type:complete len:515 (+) Transcript_9292:103-1647(+)
MKEVCQTEFTSILGNGAIRTSPPLLCDDSSASSEKDDERNKNPHDEEGGKLRSDNDSQLLRDEAQKILQLALPVCGTYLLELLPGMVGMILVGHVQSDMTKEYVDAACLGVMFFTITGFSIGVGLSSAMDTLCSQAYGAKESLRMGIYLQTGLIVLSFAFLIVCILTFFTEEILIALGQPVVVSELTEEFSLWLLPGIPFLYLYELLRKVLQAQNLATPMLVIAVIANSINAGLGYVLVYHTNIGWLGAAIARSVCNVSFGVMLLLYVISVRGIKDTFWSGWKLLEAWRGMGVFLSLGIPGLFQVCFEYWAFEVLAIMCGWMPNNIVAIGANYTLLNITSMIFMIYYGVGSSGGTCIGNALGEGDSKKASTAAKLTIGLNLILSVVFAILLIVLRYHIPRIYTHDEDVVDLVSSLLLIGSAFQIADASIETVQGVFRGSGRQKLGAILNFLTYYVIGLPLAAILAFPAQLETHGIWIGMSVSMYVGAFVGVILVARTDWDMLARDAMKRVRSYS